MDTHALVADLVHKSQLIVDCASRSAAPSDPKLKLLMELQNQIFIAGQDLERPRAMAGGSKQLVEVLVAGLSFVALLGLALLVIGVAILALLAAHWRNQQNQPSINDQAMEQLTGTTLARVRDATQVLPELQARIRDPALVRRLGRCNANADQVVAVILLLKERIIATGAIRPNRPGSRAVAAELRRLLDALIEALNDFVSCVGSQTEFGRELTEVIRGRQPLLKFLVRLLGEVTIF